MEIFFDYLPCRIRCSIFAYQFSLWNGSNPKKTSHYFRRSNVEKRRTISYKNVLEKKKKKKKKVFFLHVFILLLSPLIFIIGLPKYISKLMKPGGRQDFNAVSTYSRRNYTLLYLRADLPVKLGRRRRRQRRRDLNPLSTARDLCRNRDEKKSPSTLVTRNESISKFGSNGKFETTGVTRADRVEILDIKVVSQRWFYRDDKALVHPSIHSPGREAINLWLKRETRGQNGARQLVIRLAGDKRVSFTTAPSYFNAISRHWWRFSSRSRGGWKWNLVQRGIA